MRTIALIGDPVRQSPSPAMHRAAFAAAGRDLDYVTERVSREELAARFDLLHSRYVGLNVTRPLKEVIVPLLDEVRGEAAATGSVNTVTFADGRAIGDSTDGAGFLAALGTHPPRRALILGAGGAARAVGFALRSTGTHVTVAARDPARADGIGDVAIPLEAGPIGEVLTRAGLLVNATPLGDRSPLPEAVSLNPATTVFDLVYTPRVTVLLAAARAAGCRTVEGIEMLVEQGARSFTIWTGLDAPVEAMREAALAELEARAAV